VQRLAQGEAAQAVAVLQQVTQTEGSAPHLRHLLGDALFEAGRPEGAAVQYERALTLGFEDEWVEAYTWYCLARARRRTGDNEGAVTAYERSLALRDDYAPAHYGLGVAYHSSGDCGRAREEYEACLRLAPTHAEAQYGLGACCQATGARDEAVQWYEKSLVLSPRLAKAHLALAGLYEQAGRGAEALAHYEVYLRLEPSGPHATTARVQAQRLRYELGAEEPTPPAEETRPAGTPARRFADWEGYWATFED
jgi:tetratricopeptide (TPR) repeat protein